MTGILKIVKISKLKLINQKPFIYINNINNLLVSLGFCLFVSNKRQKGLINLSVPIFLCDLTRPRRGYITDFKN